MYLKHIQFTSNITEILRAFYLFILYMTNRKTGNILLNKHIKLTALWIFNILVFCFILYLTSRIIFNLLIYCCQHSSDILLIRCYFRRHLLANDGDLLHWLDLQWDDKWIYYLILVNNTKNLRYSRYMRMSAVIYII